MADTNEMEQALIHATAENALLKAGANVNLLKPHVLAALEVNAGGRVVVRESHHSVEEYVASMRQDADLGRAFAPPGSEPAGGELTRAAMSTSQKVAFIREHGREAYEALPATTAKSDSVQSALVRARMSVAEKVTYIRDHGREAYDKLPWSEK